MKIESQQDVPATLIIRVIERWLKEHNQSLKDFINENNDLEKRVAELIDYSLMKLK